MRRLKQALRDLADPIYLRAPYPLSRWVRDMGRRWVFKDARAPSFERIFADLARSGVQGDYLEFGCYRGSSTIMAFQLAQKHGLDGMRFFAFDSFEGLPESEGTLYRKGAFSCSLELFEKYVAQAGVDLGRVIPVKGYYSDTLTRELRDRHRIERAAVVHVDCDLYTSTREVLAFVEDIVDHGSVIIFDDWYYFDPNHDPDDFGERKAFYEWGKHRSFEGYHDMGANKSFLMKRRV